MGSDLSGRNGHALDKKFPAEREAERLANDRLRMQLAESKREGIKEVGEWIKATASLERGDRDVGLCFEDYLHFDYSEWQAKLKEWGV